MTAPEQPGLGLGTWQNEDPDACAESVRTALETGYRHVDTAQAYENERAVGRGIEAADVDREEVFLATKVHEKQLEYDQVLDTVEESLDALDVDRIDLLYVHTPRLKGNHRATDTLPAFADILRQLTPEEARMIDFIFDNAADVPGLAGPAPGVDKADLQEASALSQEQFLVRVQNLHRLELIVQLTIGRLEPVRGFRGWGQFGHVGLTALGEAFMRACRGPERVVEDAS
jgi:hypothetical protein